MAQPCDAVDCICGQFSCPLHPRKRKQCSKKRALGYASRLPIDNSAGKAELLTAVGGVYRSDNWCYLVKPEADCQRTKSRHPS